MASGWYRFAKAGQFTRWVRLSGLPSLKANCRGRSVPNLLDVVPRRRVGKAVYRPSEVIRVLAPDSRHVGFPGNSDVSLCCDAQPPTAEARRRHVGRAARSRPEFAITQRRHHPIGAITGHNERKIPTQRITPACLECRPFVSVVRTRIEQLR